MRLLVAGASWAEAGSPMVAAIASELPDLDVRAAGYRGHSLARWLPRFATRDDVDGSDILVVELGGNGVPSVSNIHDAEATFHSLGARSVRWTLPPVWPVPGMTARRRAATRANLLAAGVRTIESPQLNNGDLAHDDVHLTRGGYGRFGSAVAQAWRKGGSLGLFLLALALAVVVVAA